MKRSTFFAGIILIGFIALMVIGSRNDMAAIPPVYNYGRGCGQAFDDLYAQAPPPENPPPPSAALYGNAGAAIVEPDILPLMELHQLSSQAGFGLTGSNDPETWARRLGAGWYIDWWVRPRYPERLPEHWQMIRLGRGCIAPSKNAIRWLASKYPGNVWVVGNEPDNIWQDNVVPEEYAQVYHDLYYLIKAADPRARIAVAGVTQSTPLRLAYLDRVLLTYQALYGEPMPVDWWTVHGFVLREERGNWGAGIPAGVFFDADGILYEPEDAGSLEYFQKQIVAFRTWMAQNGYQNTPLAITEYGILLPPEYGYSPEVVAQYLTDTFRWLETAADEQMGYPEDDYHLVQRWAWFSLNFKMFYASNLADLTAGAITDIGWAFRNYVEDRRP